MITNLDREKLAFQILKGSKIAPSTKEMAKRLGCSYQVAWTVLNTLQEKGYIRLRQVTILKRKYEG